jgi:hypothetical protein
VNQQVAVFAEFRRLPVCVSDGIGEKHYARWIAAMAKPQRVPKFMHSFFQSSFIQKSAIRQRSVKFWSKSKQ